MYSKAYISNKSRNKVKSSNKEIINRLNLQTPDVTPEKQKLTASINKIYTETETF
jgi:hypothetical protein